MKQLKKGYAVFCKIEQWVAVCLLAGITILVFVSALTRYFGYPINWAQDAALVAFAWMVFLGGDIALHSTGLIGIDLLVKHFPKPVQKIIDIVFKIAILAFLCVLVVNGFSYMQSGAKRMINTLGVSYASVTAAVPVGSLFMIISVTINLITAIGTPASRWGLTEKEPEVK